MAEKTALDEAVERQYKGLSFDELNTLYDDERDPMSMDYDEYFDDMDLTDIQKLERKDSAQELEEVFRDLLALIFYLYVDGAYDYAEAIMTAQEAYGDALYGVEVSEYFRNTHIPVTVSGIVNTMLAHPENPFNFSMDRVRLIAENESNSIWNDAEYEEAIKSGKTHKKWHSIIDKKTRDSHRYLDGKIKRIEEPFEVGDSLMMYPKDESFGAGMEEIANCRCSIEYYGHDDLAVASPQLYVNKKDMLFKNSKKVKPIDGFMDYTFHGYPDCIMYETTNGVNTYYNAKECADIIKNDPDYNGGNIRLLACQTGSSDYGFARQLSDELGVDVVAPTERLWIKENGEIFITDHDSLAYMWYGGEKVNQTGNWRLFEYKEL